MGNIVVNVPGIPKTIKHGPFDVTDYLTWQSYLDSRVQTNSQLTYTLKGSRITFTEILAT